MRDYLEIGSSPSDESCVQVETGADYIPAMKQELIRYRNMLEKRFPNIPEKARFGVKWYPHDFGQYGEVVVFFDDADRDSQEFAYFVEGNPPATWDDPATFPNWQELYIAELARQGIERETG